MNLILLKNDTVYKQIDLNNDMQIRFQGTEILDCSYVYCSLRRDSINNEVIDKEFLDIYTRSKNEDINRLKITNDNNCVIDFRFTDAQLDFDGIRKFIVFYQEVK